MVDWHRFDPAEWDIEYDIEKLGAHRVTEWEAAEVIWNGFGVRPNMRGSCTESVPVGRTNGRG